MAVRSAPTDATHEVVDPVCGEVFPPGLAVFSSMHRGHTVYFCSSTCKTTFHADPAAHPPQAAPADDPETGP